MALNRPLTIEHFEEFAQRPENADRLLEFIDGEIIEKVPGTTQSSQIPLWLAATVIAFCLQHNIPCHVSGADGTYRILGNDIAPDFAYKPTPMTGAYPDPEPPVWAVEVISPSEKRKYIEAKRDKYIAAGILLWQIYQDDLSVIVYSKGQKEGVRYGVEDTITVGDILPGLTIAVKDIFKL